MSRWHVDAQCHLEPILGPKMVAKWVPKCSKIGPETALKGDSDSKLKKEGARSVWGAARELRRSTNWRVLGPLGGGKQGGGSCPHTPDNLSKDRGRRIYYLLLNLLLNTYYLILNPPTPVH